MHDALCIPEILDMILLDIGRASLPAVARTCRRFHLPAASRLWREIDLKTLEHLSSVVLTATATDFASDQKTPVTFSMSARWARFRTYAALVQHLSIIIASDSGDEGTLLRLACVYPERPLLPRLRTLHYRAFQPEALEAIILFIGPSLQEVFLNRYTCLEDHRDFEIDWMTVVPAFMEALADKAPDLRKLHLKPFIPFNYNSIHLHPIVAGLQRLRHLASFSIDMLGMQPLLLDTLIHLPTLCELSIGSNDDANDFPHDAVVFPSLSPGITGFPLLKKFTVRLSGRPSILIRLLKLLPGLLEELKFEYALVGPFQTGLLAKVAVLIAELSRIRKIDMVFTGANSDAPILCGAISPLLKCRNITHFRFKQRVTTPLDLKDRHFESMSRAWPQLISLEWSWISDNLETHGLVDKSSVTLSALLSLAWRCPSLEHVRIDALDATSLPGTAIPPPRMQLTDLEMDDGRLSNAADVAAFIGLIWPRSLVRVASSNQQATAWNKVTGMMEAIRKHRDLQSQQSPR